MKLPLHGQDFLDSAHDLIGGLDVRGDDDDTVALAMWGWLLLMARGHAKDGSDPERQRLAADFVQHVEQHVEGISEQYGVRIG
jgi:hypothetical protein